MSIYTYKIATYFFQQKLMYLVALLVIGVAVQAQQTYSGAVTNASSQPLNGVSVVLQGTTRGTTTNAEGLFTISANPGQVLTFSMIGYKPHDERLTQNNKLKITLTAAADSSLNDVVVIGYGTAKKKDVTGSIAHLDKEVLKTKVATSFVDFLKGSVAGVNIGINNNASGGGSIEIRGPSSMQASTAPLIVLDGAVFYGNINDINPNDIESIDVLKDASATAIYGSKGSAGVIAVTTKRGTTEQPVVNFSTKVGFAQIAGLPPLPNPEQYVQRRLDYFKTLNYLKPNTDRSKKPFDYYDNPNQLTTGSTKDQWAAYDPSFSGDYTDTWLTRLQFGNLEIENYKAGKTVDWRDAVYQTGLRQDHNISYSGRASKTTYYTSLGYIKNQGFFIGDDFQAVRGRINLESNITKWLKIGTNTQFADRSDNTISADVGGADVMSPFGSMYEANGELKKFPTNDARIINPLLNNLVDRYLYKVQTLNANMFARLTLPYGLSFQTSFNNRYGWRKNYYFHSDIKPGIPVGGSASRDEFSDYEWIVDNVLNWNYRIGTAHQFDVTLGQSSEKYQLWSTTENNQGFLPNSNLIYHNLNAGTTPITNSNDEIQTGTSLFGRINYNLLNTYLFTASLRRDGFSAFGQENPYGTYPSLAFAWRISQEKFMNNSLFNDLKLRLSWGESGNRDIGRYAALAYLNLTDNIINGQNVKGVWQGNLPNYKLKWETTHTYDVGVDFGMFNNRLTGVIDAYSNNTTDLVLMRALPQITGYTNIIANLGQVNNKGLEVTLTSTNILIPDKVNWRTSFIFSANRNSIVHLYGDTDSTGKELDDVQSGWYIGHSRYDILDYKVAGIWQLGEEIPAKKYGKQPGDPRVLDVDGDSVLTNSDRIWLGSRIPRYRASFRSDLNLFKNFNFSFVIRGEFDYWAADNLPRNEDNRYFDRNNSLMSDYWTPWNALTGYARLGSNSGNPSIQFYKRRDYVKLQNASLSYTVTEGKLSKYYIQNLRLSLNVDNAFVITKWKYFDPETVGRVPRIFTVGLDVTL